MSENRSSTRSGPAILQVVPRLDAGGAERSAVEIAAALAHAGFVPLVASEGGRMVAEFEAAGGEWLPMPLDAKSPSALLANARRLRDLIRRRNIRLVHARSRAPAWSALWAARRTGTAFVTTFHGAYAADFPLKRLYNSVMLRGDAVIANSQWTADHIREDYWLRPKRLVVIPRGVDLDRFDPAGVPRERVLRLREAWGAGREQSVVLLPGRMTRWKGQLILIEAAARLAQKREPGALRVVFAGDAQGRDDYTAEVERAVERHRLGQVVAIAGHVEDMAAAYLASDIVVSASTKPEAFGRVAAEGAAMARPVIATDHGGARETVLADTSGLLVPPGDPATLAEALTKLLDAGPAARAAMGAAGRAHIQRHFTLERMTGETIGLYRELLGPLAAK
ncbi:MAG TPA: glycosyltransferase family 4 protein [Rhizomicrobium sp.]|nr:glycosyltransferase family 4 protein [Rhizomicrobium sp.]